MHQGLTLIKDELRRPGHHLQPKVKVALQELRLYPIRPHPILVTDSAEVAHGDVLSERQQAPHDGGLLITDTAQDVDVEPQLLAGEWVVLAAVVKTEVS